MISLNDLDVVTHIPSALSQLEYIDFIFSSKLVVPYRDRIIIGKPFGCMAYYLTWFKNGYIKEPMGNNILKTDDFDFVDYSDEIVGNALGIASGMDIVNQKFTWVNMSDSALMSGVFLESAQFVGNNKQNIKITVDFNKMKLTSDLNFSDEDVIKLFESFKFSAFICETNEDIKLAFLIDGPVIMFIKTNKGSKAISEHYIASTDLKEYALTEFNEVLNEKNISKLY